MIIDTICRYFLWFVLYSFIGWLCETLLYMLRDGKVVKRGFLFGPLCPIYGFGGGFCILLLYGRVHNIFYIFLLGMTLTSALEYLTHFFMEKLFHAMWWDYSNRRFNLNGRIYLKGCLFFGVGITILIRFVHPFVAGITSMIPKTAMYIMCFVLYTILLLDVATMVSDLRGTARALKNLQSRMLSTTQKGVTLTGEQLEQAKKKIQSSELYLRMTESSARDDPLIERFRKRYPNFTFKRYKYILDLLKDAPQEDKGRSDLKLYGTADSLPRAEEETDAPENADTPDEENESEA